MKHLQIQLEGKVQGVGFRPFVYRLAQEYFLKGAAKNTLEGLSIQVFGENSHIDAFLDKLINHPPKHAKITKHSSLILPCSPAPNFTEFTILNPSEKHTCATSTPLIAGDRALCSSCLSELFTPTNRRFLHPFISCLECGPRASIVRHLPYEREFTSYSDFELCSRCEQETFSLVSSQEQRFHSQTNACWQCGPSLSLYHQGLSYTDDQKYFQRLASALQAGEIIAIKGIGGFHLICDAYQAEPIEKIRQFKHRPDKPFAVMALNSESFGSMVEMSDDGKSLLESEKAPIVLFPKKIHTSDHLERLAPKVGDLGCMLPYTAIHYLIFHALLGQPSGTQWLGRSQAPLLLVTSANLSGEPLISDNTECLEKLSNVASFILTHDRTIAFSSDDSVVQIQPSLPQYHMMIRHARGYAPEPFPLPFPGKAVLALGAHLKNTFCLTADQQAFLSPHLGEINSLSQYEHFETILNYYLQHHGVKPELIACDLHPDFHSSHYALEFANQHQIPLIKIPHHQAHIASVLVEANLPANSRFIGLALDGIGLGQDITLDQHVGNHSPALWGGELFYGELINTGASSNQLNLKHRAQLASIPLPGGDKATTEIGRIAYALLKKLHVQHLKQPQSQWPKKLSDLLDSQLFIDEQLKDYINTNLANFPQTSSLGRWFDGVSSLLGIRQQVTYEGQAAIELETLAARYGALPPSQGLCEIDLEGNLNVYPLLPKILSYVDTHEASAIFHSEICDGLLRWLLWHSKQHQTTHILCSGGCFQNKIIAHTLLKSAHEKGLIIHLAENIPVNDAGISIGQAIIASLHPTT